MNHNRKQLTKAAFLKLCSEHKLELIEQLRALNQIIKSDYLFIATMGDSQQNATTVATLVDGEPSDSLTYNLINSPCESVFDQQACVIPFDVQEIYPDDTMLADLSLEGYVGCPITLDNQQTVAIIVGLFRSALLDADEYKSLFELFSENIANYIESAFHAAQLAQRTELLNEVCALSKVGAWEFDHAHNSLYWSPEVFNIYGLPVTTSLSPELGLQFYHPEDIATITYLFERALNAGEEYTIELRMIDAAGVHKWVRTSGKPRQDQYGNIVGVYGALEDVTEEIKRYEEEARKARSIEDIFNNFNDAVIICDEQGDIQQVNRAATRIFGYSHTEFLAMSVEDLMPEPYRSAHSGYMQRYLETGESTIMGVGRQLPALRKNNDTFQMELSLTESGLNSNAKFIGIVRDISERIKAQDTVYKMAYTDSLTGLKNRAWFVKTLQTKLEDQVAANTYLFCAIVDIDKLAQWNHKFSITAGNQIVHDVGRILEERCNGDFALFKNGADSFILMGTSSLHSADEGALLQQKLMSFINGPDAIAIDVANERIQVSVSTGSALLKLQQCSIESLFSSLEYAVKRAKQSAPFGNFYLDEQSQETYERSRKIKNAIDGMANDGKGLRLVLQPQFDKNGVITSSEALVRWTSDAFGVVSPGEFIPIAEETNAIINIDEWVITRACDLLAQLAQQGIDTKISVNVSGKHLLHVGFKHFLLNTVNHYGVAPSSLMLELTETTLVTDIEAVRQLMLDLKSCGFAFSIDDFGTGYSSLAYLQSLPIAELKIDKRFVDGIDEQGDDSAKGIVKLIVDMANVLHTKTVAEGVESAHQAEYLTSIGCDAIQGFLKSKPLEVSDWIDKLSQT